MFGKVIELMMIDSPATLATVFSLAPVTKVLKIIYICWWTVLNQTVNWFYRKQTSGIKNVFANWINGLVHVELTEYLVPIAELL